jgi:hypothetical protein
VREIPELLRRVPGVTVAYENGSNYTSHRHNL